MRTCVTRLRSSLLYAVTFILLVVISFSIFYYRIYSVAIEPMDDELREDIYRK